MWAKLWKWVIFSIVFPLVPLFVIYMKDVLVGADVTPLWVFVARGALLTLTIGLSVGAMAELASSALHWTGREMTALAVSAINAICATVFYTYVSDAYASALLNNDYIGDWVNIGATTLTSSVMYGVAILTGGWCVILTARAEGGGNGQT